MLNWRQPLASDHQGELVERDRHPPGDRLLDRQLIGPRRRFWTKAWPAITVLALRSWLSPRIGRNLALRRPWSASMWLLACRSVSCHAAGSNSSKTTG